MVSSEDDTSTKCIVRTLSTQNKYTFLVRPNYLVKDFIRDVARNTDIQSFELLLEANGFVFLNEHEDKTLLEVGINFDYGSHNDLLLRPMKKEDTASEVTEKISINTLPMADSMSDDDLALGASASPTEPADSTTIPQPPALMFNCELIEDQKPLKAFKERRKTTAFVGLVNQAMTCYLNSLLQALFMTPEFRNALYKWEFDGVGESKNIPYQLQKLFLKLQTSEKPSIETTDLTRSFGWDSTEAWQQHDIQELCRVMFDALEQKFKNTQQADLINQLYQGKMTDYVKCLECGTEKSREDTFLDIPLSVKPFGSTVAYGSVEEALRAFVQPETLEEGNQYSCETCNKKCNAHKGLKFSQFPYILTLHLKRFDFDYMTLRRIKLNDKVTFPQTLNLNNLVNTSNPGFGSASAEAEVATKVSDDCSTVTTDSGSALEEENCSGTTTITNNDQDIQEDDEGIDMSTSTDHKTTASHASGPYIYELFSIMIHSGSASGGHYYAYIKDFDSSEWYCFNDQSVTSITQEDIQKSFGGGRALYSGAYSSSINAYMLMYRQVDPQRNTSVMSKDDFPQHIKDLAERLDKQQSDPDRPIFDCGLKIKVYFYHPVALKMEHSQIDIQSNSTLDVALTRAYNYLGVSPFYPMENCRLVAYDRDSEAPVRSFEGREQDPIGDLWNPYCSYDLLIETRNPEETFDVYEESGISTRVFLIDLATMDFDGPIHVFANGGKSKVGEYREAIKKKLNVPETEKLHVAYMCMDNVLILEEDDNVLRQHLRASTKVFVTRTEGDLDDDAEAAFKIMAEKCSHLMTVYIVLPERDQETLNKLSIPAYKPKTVSRAATPVQEALPVENGGVSPLPESNSEDSSLSDGDKTLVESLPSVSLNHSAKDEKKPQYTFKAFPCEKRSTGNRMEKPIDVMKVLVDRRMQIGELKTHLEEHVGVPDRFFNVIRKFCSASIECTLTETLISYKECEGLTVELGRVLNETEHMCKVYFLKISELSEEMEKLPFVCDWILEDGTTVADTKARLIKYLASVDEKYAHLTPERCRLRKKSWRTVGKVFTDDQVFNDGISISLNFEMILQEVDESAPAEVDPEDVVLLLRRWNPSTLTLDPFHEIAFGKSGGELRKVISELSKIPLDDVEYDKVSSAFPRNNIPLMTMNTVLEWTKTPLDYEAWSTNDGNVFYYRDAKEELKEITAEDRKQLNAKEMFKSDQFSGSTYSPRREKALKIYLDLSPKKQSD
ncbi:ubiquitin carboxyl-terminal hydrolase 47 isoform X2 [Phlebotomus argentipes]|uniref:ubiquitin carboxyl-terminal hydrolase 47 isoform X2 n=1 Tax=Phlebotomus argentipes TaxID=94469 RepID=UPI002892A0A3|nr:ubiquitin carboxyl-terminal hydrolase 47 isoform X2 [Phlebotomus argentipes]